MPRPEGSKNKPKSILDMPEEMSDEDLFLAELIKGKAFWNAKAKELKEKGHDNKRVIEYSEAYKLLIHQFTIMDKPST